MTGYLRSAVLWLIIFFGAGPDKLSTGKIAKNVTTICKNNGKHTLGKKTRQKTHSTKNTLGKQRENISENVADAIKTYRETWNEPNAPVTYLDDALCRKLIKKAKKGTKKSFFRRTVLDS